MRRKVLTIRRVEIILLKKIIIENVIAEAIITIMIVVVKNLSITEREVSIYYRRNTNIIIIIRLFIL